jgi:hypothetical protein
MENHADIVEKIGVFWKIWGNIKRSKIWKMWIVEYIMELNNSTLA